MKKQLIISFCLILGFSLNSNLSLAQKAEILRFTKEAHTAFIYLNQIRNNPPAFSKEMGIDLSTISNKNALIWDERLARSAQKKAEDMAGRNYLGHFTPEGIGPGEFARREGYYLPLNWPDSTKFNYIESISGGSSKTGTEHIKNLIYDRGAPHSSSKANHRKHLLGMNKFWSKHIHVGIGFAYSPDSKYKGYFVVHTGVPGTPFVIITGKLLAPKNKISGIHLKKIWVGAIDKTGNKYWTSVTIPEGESYSRYSLRVPQETKIILRYYKQFSKKNFSRGYYTEKGIVFKKNQAKWIEIKKNDIPDIDLTFSIH